MSPRALQRCVAIACALLVAAPVAAQAASAKLDHALRNETKSGKMQPVIVRATPGYRDNLRHALKACEHVIKTEHALVESVTAEVRGDCLEKLAADNTIYSIGSDAEVTASGDFEWATVPSNTLRKTLGESDSSTGASVGVAVIDSGIAALPAFSGRIVGFFDFTSGATIATAPHDEYGHGTHVAGLIGAHDSPYMGVAPQAHLLGLKVLDRRERTIEQRYSCH